MIARYELHGGTVKLVVLVPRAEQMAAAPMQGLNYLPDGGELRKVMPSEGQEFFLALIQQGQRMSYYDYVVEYA